MKVIRQISEMQNFSNACRRKNQQIGFVPTMGFLHEGHLSLIRLIRKQCDVLVVSIFVNPAQFGPTEDLKKYPRDFERDEALCRDEGVDVIFYPAEEQMYPAPYLSFVTVENLDKIMCGVSRPDHFRGVVTIVSKLFNIVKPHFAIFGEKDFQQAVIIRQMTKDLNFDVEILTGPIIRENDGLALSSRNKYLNKQERFNATILFKSLQVAQDLFKNGIKNPREIMDKVRRSIQDVPGTKIDYISLVNPETLQPVQQVSENDRLALAVYIGKTRLIDNVALGK
jgi:pantoate--beta-alanine ligase